MQSADPATVSTAVRDGWRMRVGRKLGRTLYLRDPDGSPEEDVCVGIVDTAELAGEIARIWNADRDR